MKKILLGLLAMIMAAPALAQGHYVTKEDIPYIAMSDTSSYRKERCKLDVYYPTDTKPFKTLVWFHGGGLEGGSKRIMGMLKNRGFAIVAPNYRLFPKAQCPQYIEDAAAAVAWVFRHIEELGGDTHQIYVGGHSAGGYLALMLALDKHYLATHGVDADSVRAYFPVSGQTATHYTIRKERHLSFTTPIVDQYAPLNQVRKLDTRLLLITGDRRLEQMARYEENLYLKAVLEGIGNKNIPIYEMPGFDHGSVLGPAFQIITKEIQAGH